MQINRLTLTNFRAFEQAEFEFQPGMNLLVGINGVGKSTVLDALRIMFSQILPQFTASKSRPENFSVDDIRVGSGALTAELEFKAANIDFNYLVHKPREQFIIRDTEVGEEGEEIYDLVEQQVLSPGKNEIPKHLKIDLKKPLVVYFSTRRSLANMAAPNKQSIVGNQSTAFANALSHRELRLREFAEWLLVQETMEREGKQLAEQYISVLNNAVTNFLDTCTGLEPVTEPTTTLLLNKGGIKLDVRWLSDGERAILALILDLARRLSQANPELENPLQDGKAVVLIDELDLHLHPRWQRNIVNKLTTTFPNCQFIATTHSPQIIGEVESESILIIERGEQPFRPDQSLGMDSNWILRYLMEASDRDWETEKNLEEISQLIKNEKYDEATDKIDQLRDQIGDFPELVRLETRIDRIRLLGEY
jgi:predicted ATP-binding protein involved in virulence